VNRKRRKCVLRCTGALKRDKGLRFGQGKGWSHWNESKQVFNLSPEGENQRELGPWGKKRPLCRE